MFKTLNIRQMTIVGLIALFMAVGFSFSSGAAEASENGATIDPILAVELDAVSGVTPLEVVIVFDDVAAAAGVEALAADFLLLDNMPMAGAILTKDQINTVANMSGIESIYFNQTLEYFLAESIELIKADQVWNTYGQRGGNPSVTVAVIDSGIDGAHPDLLYGQKTIQNVKMTLLGAGVENVPTTDNTSGHGTHVAGTIGGLGVMSDGLYTGVAPDVKLIGLGSGEAISILTAVQSYDWVLSNHEQYGIRIVSNSWGTSGGDLDLGNPVNIASYEAYKLGILSVFAAGNDGGYDILNPYSIVPWVLSVAAGDKSFNLAGFSSRGKDGDFYKHPDITAPGVDIIAARCACVGVTATSGLNPVNPLYNAHYASLNGTSMATPHVSGVAALLLSQNPQLSPDEMMDLLTLNSTPMPGYSLFEVGYGYLDALSSFEASLNVAGNLSNFLAGDRDQSLEQEMGVDVDSLTYESVTYSGYSSAAASSMPANTYPVSVNEAAVLISVDLSWTPAEEDAFDLELVDPNGVVVASSGNSAGEAESLLYAPETTGTHTVRIVPFAAVNAEYSATITTGYGDLLDGYGENVEPQFDFVFTVQNLFKSYVAVGLNGGNHFQGGDSGFIVFNFYPTDGEPIDRSADLEIAFVDEAGNVATQIASARETAGEYQATITLDNNFALEPGEIEVFFNYNGTGNVRPAADTSFFFNKLDTTVATDGTDFYPGDAISFSGTISRDLTLATTTLQPALNDADVAVSLVNSDGVVLATDTVTADTDGYYSGVITSPAETRGTITVLAEAVYSDPTILTGPADWKGSSETTVIFPGNLVPEVSLSAAATTDLKGRTYLHMNAVATDPDGVFDIVTLEITIHDGDGRQIRRYRTNHFTPLEDEWLFTRSQRAKGAAPWTITFTVQDSAGNSSSASQTVE